MSTQLSTIYTKSAQLALNIITVVTDNVVHLLVIYTLPIVTGEFMIFVTFCWARVVRKSCKNQINEY